MCGIAGIVATASGRRGMLDRLGVMARAMTHRGPDGEGTYVSEDGAVGLVNRRLAIVDLSAAARMPMRSEDGTVCLTYNGEIYNAAELRAELAQRGARFRSSSDTEVVLHGYAHWGDRVVERLAGMFAFGLHDERRRALLLARDRLGIKPLFLAAGGEGLAFASELTALRAAGLIGPALSPVGVVGYLLAGSVPSPWTIYDDARAFEPATVGVVDVDRVSVATRRYWSLPSTVRAVPWAQAVREVREALAEAVRSHLVADVPVGAFLSGGLDSTAVVALMRAATNGPLRTCSIVFGERGLDEGPFARLAAEHIGAEHHEQLVTSADVERDLGRVFRFMDQPTVDGVNTYFVSKAARERGLRVALSGLGGDELFGGYDRTFRTVPRLLSALGALRRVPGAVELAGAVTRRLAHQRWRKLDAALARPPSLASAYLACRGLFAPTEVAALVEPELWRAACRELEPVAAIAARAGVPANGSTAGRRQWVSRAELRTYMHDQLLRDTDVMSMAHSLEVRVPLLDHRVVETVLPLAAAFARRGGRPKALLAAATADLVPTGLRGRPKQGFVLPFGSWLRGPLRGLCARPERLTGILRADAWGEVTRALDSGRVHWSRPWALAALSGWAATAR